MKSNCWRPPTRDLTIGRALVAAISLGLKYFWNKKKNSDIQIQDQQSREENIGHVIKDDKYETDGKHITEAKMMDLQGQTVEADNPVPVQKEPQILAASTIKIDEAIKSSNDGLSFLLFNSFYNL